MSGTHATLRLRRDLVEAARKEAELFGRSTAAQIEHWARLGRAFEPARGATTERVRQALQGRLSSRPWARSSRTPSLTACSTPTWIRPPASGTASPGSPSARGGCWTASTRDATTPAEWMGRPVLYVIAGHDCPGKTTLHQEILAHQTAAPFVNADRWRWSVSGMLPGPRRRCDTYRPRRTGRRTHCWRDADASWRRRPSRTLRSSSCWPAPVVPPNACSRACWTPEGGLLKKSGRSAPRARTCPPPFAPSTRPRRCARR